MAEDMNESYTLKLKVCLMCVFKIRCNDTYHTRKVVCRYSQVPGVDFSQNYLPVRNDIKLRVLQLVAIHFNFSADIVDIEAAFLYRELEEEI